MCRAKVNVWFTHTYKLRARIQEKGQPAYQVTIGGRSWRQGKGRKHLRTIVKKADRLLERFFQEYQDHIKSEH